MSDVDDTIDREASPADAARVATVVASDFRFAYFGTAAFAVRLLRLDQKLVDGIPMNPRRMANVLNTKPELLREFCGHLILPGDETVVLFADGRRSRFRARHSNGGLGDVHLCLMDMTALGASHGPVLEVGAGRRNALDRRATLASRAAG